MELEIKVKEMYKVVTERDNLVRGNGENRALVTGWTKVDSIVPHLKPTHYQVIGNVHSADLGIGELLINLLNNPQITEVLALFQLNQDKTSGVRDALVNFFTRGYRIEENGIYIEGTEVRLPYDIPEELLRLLRNYVTFKWFYNKDHFIDHINFYRPIPKVIARPKYNLKHVLQLETSGAYLPKVKGLTLHCNTVEEAWIKSVDLIDKKGFSIGDCKEIQMLTTVITRNNDKGRLVTSSMYFDEEGVKAYYESLVNPSSTEDISYTYGDFISYQLPDVVNHMRDNMETRQAVICLWGERVEIEEYKPCLNHIWFRVVDKQLVMCCLFRSQDIGVAYPLNTIALMMLQERVAKELGLGLGEFINTACSAHCYSTMDVDRLVKNNRHVFKEVYADSVGYFLIQWVSDTRKIQVIQKWGNDYKIYESTRPMRLIREIAENNPEINPSHMGYLGLELSRCIMLKEEYIQD